MKTKKSGKTMRVAGLLLALVLVTSCFVGGTFAKYVTSGEGSDKARVAKFGVEVAVGDKSMFSTTYGKDTNDTSATLTNTVESSDTDKLVAPGTKENETLTFSVKGTPEVAVNVQMGLTVTSDVFLADGSYKDYTKAPYTGNFTLDDDYYPVVFTLKQGTKEVATGNLEAIQTYLKSVSKDYAAKTNLSNELGEYTLSWAWAFEDKSNANVDKADTLLGNLAADATTVAATGKWENDGFTTMTAKDDYSTNIDFTLTLTVTQID